jgi:recombination protein RecA
VVKKDSKVPAKKTARQLMDEVNAAMGGKALRPASDKSLVVKYLPTGMLPFDILLQGGFPKGRVTMVHGDWSTLKSLLGLCAIAETQRNGGTAALIDTEHAFDPEWAEKIGVNNSELLVWPDREDDDEHTGEEAVDTAQVLTANGCDFIVFDSIAAALPQAESNKRLKNESIQPGRLASLMSAAMRRLTAVNNGTAFLFVNQTRLNIGVTFGSNEALPGGKAVPFYSSYILSIKKTGKVNRDARTFNGEKWVPVKEQVGQVYKAELIKSKLNKPFREIWFTWDLTTGEIDMPAFLIAQGLEHGIITLKGNTWEGVGLKAVGREKFKALLASNAEALASLEISVREFHGLDTTNLTTALPTKAIVKGAKSSGGRALVKKKARPLRKK